MQKLLLAKNYSFKIAMITSESRLPSHDCCTHKRELAHAPLGGLEIIEGGLCLEVVMRWTDYDDGLPL